MNKLLILRTESADWSVGSLKGAMPIFLRHFQNNRDKKKSVYGALVVFIPSGIDVT